MKELDNFMAIKRHGRPEEVAGMVAWLAGPRHRLSLAPCTPSTERLAPDTSGRRCALCTAAAGDVIAVRDHQARLSTAIKKRSSVSISRASGDWCALRIIQPSSGARLR